MRFNVQSKTLLARLSSVSKVVSSKNAISILDNFLFCLDGTKLVVTGSDQENTLTTSLEVTEAEGSGKFAVNVKYLLEALKGLTDQNLIFEINDANFEINIHYQNGNYNFIGINGNEFPQKEINEVSTKSLTISSKEIQKAISNTIFAVATEDIRPIMMGILWDIQPDNITFVASDTHKLVRYTNKKIKTNLEASFILPTKPASILMNFLQKTEEPVSIVLDETSVTFTTKEYTLNCRFINGRYPNYNSVIPTNNPYILTADRVCLLNAVKRVSVFASVGGLIKFDLKEDTILLKAQDIDFSTSAEEMLSCDYKGDNMMIGFNDARIVEVLNNIDNDTIIVNLSDPSRAGVFLPSEQEEDEELLVLLMPMMI
ncbi:MAG: DNA polymerase III subunit beta [Muribaculaceae bacterium]|nr:DNA polymerase III subunit beta [Muribaculaceae bacterium]